MLCGKKRKWDLVTVVGFGALSHSLFEVPATYLAAIDTAVSSN